MSWIMPQLEYSERLSGVCLRTSRRTGPRDRERHSCHSPWNDVATYVNSFCSVTSYQSLMSTTARAASKDLELEDTYLKLLKETSTHEKAITRDLGRFELFSKEMILYSEDKLNFFVEPFLTMIFSRTGKGLDKRICSMFSRPTRCMAFLKTDWQSLANRMQRYDPQVGYCQGLPFIVAILLLNVCDFELVMSLS